MNTVAHELHHIGVFADDEAVARAGPRARLPSWPKALFERLRLVKRSLEN